MSDPGARVNHPPETALGVLFFASGISGLVYEVVWMRMLVRAFGVTIFAVSTVLTVFMAGLAFGSIVVGRRLARRTEPLRGYAFAEILIGVTALISTLLMARLPVFYGEMIAGRAGSPPLVALVRFSLSLAVLSGPTVLMGATLPLLSGHLARIGRTHEEGAGLLYGLNTLGAVLGVIGSGFFLLYLLGETRTVAVAVAINVGVGLLAWVFSRQARTTVSELRRESEAVVDRGSSSERGLNERILLVYGLSGFCALAYQVIWSRMLNLVLGNSVYGFSSMLAAYLIGLAIGSLAITPRVPKLRRPLAVLGAMQVAVALLALASIHVYVAIGQRNRGEDYAYSQIWQFSDFGAVAAAAVEIVLPLTLVLGAMFPVAARLVTSDAPAEVAIGRLYGYNTIGAILGSFITGFVLVPAMGMHLAFVLVSLVSFALGAYVLHLSGRTEQLPSPRVLILAAGIAVSLAVSLTLQDPFLSVFVPRLQQGEEIIAHEETAAATVTATTDATTKHLFINGLYVSTVSGAVGSILVHMPLSFHPDPKRALVIGLGAGEAFRAAMDHGLSVRVAELVPTVYQYFKLFHPDHEKYLGDPRGEIRFEDGRNYLLSSDETFDLVVADVTPPVFSSGAVNVYSYEFVELVSRHLGERGIFALWFPTPCFESDFWMVARNFSDVFPSFRIWARPGMTGIVLLGSPSREQIFDVSDSVLAERLARAQNLDPGINPVTIRAALFENEQALRARAAEFPRVTDDHPLTEFPLERFWRGVEYSRSSAFLQKIVDATATSHLDR